ncbi:MAG: hypothetical protein ABI239_11685, partial [Aquihabitans sp.]
MVFRPRSIGRRPGRALIGVLALSLVAAACGGAKSSDGASDDSGSYDDKQLTAEDGESGLADAGDPVRG